MNYDTAKKRVIWAITGILVWGLALVLLRLAMLPVDGYLVPVVRDDGQATGFFYKRVSWWGLRVKQYGAYYKKGSFYYDMNGTIMKIDDSKYVEE